LCYACQCEGQEALDVRVCGGFGGFVLEWSIFTWHAVHSLVNVFVFLGFKGGLGHKEGWGEVERSPSVVIADDGRCVHPQNISKPATLPVLIF